MSLKKIQPGYLKLFYLKLIIVILFSLFIIFPAAGEVSDVVNDIHITKLDELKINNTNGTIKLYFKLEKAKLVNPNWKKGTVVKRTSPTTGKDGYYRIEPIIDAKTEDFTVRESPKGKNDFIPITPMESDLQIINAPKDSKIFSILLLDVSGSITRSANSKTKPVLGDLKEASKVFVESMNIAENRQLAIYGFDGREDLIPINEFSKYPEIIKSNIDKIDTSITKDFSTNLYGAIVKALEILDQKIEENVSQGAITSGILTIFTDGTDRARRLGVNGDQRVLESMNDLLKKRKNVYFYTIGLGEDFDQKVLKDFGISGYRKATSAGSLAPTFKDLAETIDNLSKCYYKLQYQTPSRKGSGEMSLIIDVKNSGYAGGYRIHFDTSSFNF